MSVCLNTTRDFLILRLRAVFIFFIRLDSTQSLLFHMNKWGRVWHIQFVMVNHLNIKYNIIILEVAKVIYKRARFCQSAPRVPSLLWAGTLYPSHRSAASGIPRIVPALGLPPRSLLEETVRQRTQGQRCTRTHTPHAHTHTRLPAGRKNGKDRSWHRQTVRGRTAR